MEFYLLDTLLIWLIAEWTFYAMMVRRTATSEGGNLVHGGKLRNKNSAVEYIFIQIMKYRFAQNRREHYA
jgi:hypothetical protein